MIKQRSTKKSRMTTLENFKFLISLPLFYKSIRYFNIEG